MGSGIFVAQLFGAALAGFTCLAAAQNQAPFVSPIFGDNLVLQRGKTNVIWGWSKPGEMIKVEVGAVRLSTAVLANGCWEARFLPPRVPGPHTIRISGPQTVLFTNIAVGDVWLCGGQSNMEFPLARAEDGTQEVAGADHPDIRLFTVQGQPAYSPKQTMQGAWKVCSPKTVTEDGGFSAVGYFFALKIRSQTNVPIGLIKNAMGGTPAESWTSAEGLRPLQDFNAALNEVDRLRQNGAPEYGNYISHWYDEFDVGQKNNWNSPDLDDGGWKIVNLPGGFDELGVPETPAVCYFRKSVVLPDPLPSGPAKIFLGVIEKMDTTQINGRWVGASAWVENPRVYIIEHGILKPGKNVISVRVLKTRADGGFQSKPETLRLVLGDNTEIPLAGEWKGKVAVDAKPPLPLPMGFENWPTMPSVLYNGMIAPLAPLAFSGALWYQGEANASRASQYRKLLPAMIADWRRAFQQGDFPFYIVSLAAFMQHKDQPGDDGWAELREAQALTAKTVRNSGLAVTIDIGDANDIHPKQKKQVGERLALWALANHYGIKTVCSGPTLDRFEQIQGAMKVHFKNTEGGLLVKGDKLGEFAIAGDDKKWVWADARVEGNAVVVSSPSVSEPKFVRYAWQANPVATLFNGAGLPAVPFRTDEP